MDDGPLSGASQLLARAGGADVRAAERLGHAIDDFFLPDAARLDDRLRAALGAALGDLAAAIEGALRQHSVRLLAARGAPTLGEMITQDGDPILTRLLSAGLLRDSDLMRELIGRVRHDVLAEALPVEAPDDIDRPSLLARLAQHGDSVVATSALTLLAAESRRRATEGSQTRSDLPAELHHRLVWWVAATLRERFADTAGADLAILDRAIAEAALRSVGAHDESDRMEAAALRLAAALDATADELPALLVEALADRRLSLFTGLLGHALGLDYADAREIVLDPAADRLWLVLRALELDRASIARIGLALSDADPRRDIDAFAEALDAIAATTPADARAALAPLMLHPDYRAALLALARGPRP